MRKGGIIVFGIAALAVWAGFRSRNQVQESIQQFRYGIGSFKFNFKNLLKPEISFVVTVFNPNKSAVPVTDVLGAIKFKDTVLSSFKSAQPFTIEAEQTKTITINAKVSALNVVTSLLRKSAAANVQISGLIKTTLFDFPISKSISLKNS